MASQFIKTTDVWVRMENIYVLKRIIVTPCLDR